MHRDRKNERFWERINKEIMNKGIDPREIRIGNIINGGHHLGNRDLVVKSIEIGPLKEYVIRFEGEEKGNYPEKCEGVPITDKWLDKFLIFYQKSSGEYITSYNDRSYHVVLYWNKRCEIQLDSISIEFDYVHQLQNWHFVLTGSDFLISK